MCTGYDPETPGKQTITITYKDFEFTYEIEVKVPEIVDADLIKEPNKKEYEKGEEFDPDGGVIRVEYSDGTIIEVPVTEDMCTGYDPEKPGKQTITITYEGFEFTYEIIVDTPFVPETGDNDNIFYLLLAIAIAGGFVLQTKILKKKCYEV
jgi:LPXTG-motif cell wall-anchored protein